MKSKRNIVIKLKVSTPDFIDVVELPFQNDDPTLLKILHCGKEGYSKYYEAVRNYGRSFLFLYTTGGQVNLERDNEKTVLRKGDLAIISFKEYSRLSMDENTRWSNLFLCIYGPIADGFYGKIKEESATLIRQFDPSPMVRIIEKAIKDKKEGSYSSFEMSKMLYDFILNVGQSLRTLDVNPRFKSIFQYISEHYQENISLEQLSSVSGFSKFYICRMIKKETGQTFNDFLNTQRLNRAEELLITTNLTNADIAVQTGFGDPRNMYYFFKKKLKTTPQEYRSSRKIEYGSFA